MGKGGGEAEGEAGGEAGGGGLGERTGRGARGARGRDRGPGNGDSPSVPPVLRAASCSRRMARALPLYVSRLYSRRSSSESELRPVDSAGKTAGPRGRELAAPDDMEVPEARRGCLLPLAA